MVAMQHSGLPRFVAWSLAALAVALSAAGLAVPLLVPSPAGGHDLPSLHMLFLPLMAVTYAVMGALVASRRPGSVIGWILSVVGALSGLTLLSATYAATTLPGVEIARWLDLWVWMPVNILPLAFLLLLFPDGRLPSPRWRPIAWAAGLGLAGSCLGMALLPGPAIGPEPMPNPFGIPGAAQALDLLTTIAGVLLAVGTFGSLAALVVRFRRSRGSEREQMKWMAYAGSLSLLSIVAVSIWSALAPGNPLVYEVSLATVLAGLTLIGLATGIAVLRYRLYDIDLVINRTLVYGALTAAVAAIYILAVGGLGMLLQTSGSLLLSLLGAGLAAIVVQPARDRLQRGVNRLMYGERDDPYAVLSRLAERLEGTLAPDAVLPNVVDTVAQALKLPYVAIALAQEPGDDGPTGEMPIVAAHGAPAGELLHLPLVYQGEVLGALIAAPRAGESFSPADRRLLGDLARQAGVAAHAVRLTAGLQRSREQLVMAREEERRRLRRDLHDGLGSQLAALHLQTGTLRKTLPPGIEETDAGVAELQAGIHAAIADIRRLVYGLRPPALDELGLAGALRSLAAQVSSANGLQVQVDAPEQLPALRAAVEVAAYRIAQEALANVVRHSGAHSARVRLSVVEDLGLEIQDDGRGLAPDTPAGVGLRSMRERAAEVGGTCAVENLVGGGVQVRVRLPLARAKE